ncbi:MAG: discoidin domain-containing protein [Oscillospiraceae bacterium]|nr:discoidin domain-containing protein [Oscillospiraceae bacterium]
MNNKAKTIIIVILCVIIAGALGFSFYKICADSASDEPNPNVTLVTTPEQSDFELHPEWGGSKAQYTDYGENLAKGKITRSNGYVDGFGPANATDGKVSTYWEGAAGKYPNEMVIDMGSVTEMGAAQIKLVPESIWGCRLQEIEIQVSVDGENYTTVYPKTMLTFDSAKTNSAYMPFTEAVSAQYVKVLFHSNNGAGGGQASEIEVFAP